MNLPGKHTNLGRVLRAMQGGQHMTAGQVRRAAGLHPDTAVTARIRDLRKLGCEVYTYSFKHPSTEEKRVWKYWLRKMPAWMRRELRREASRGWMGEVAA